MEKIKEGARGDKSRDAVIQKFKNGEKEKNVVKVVCGAYGVNDKSVRRCVAGLDLIEHEDGGCRLQSYVKDSRIWVDPTATSQNCAGRSMELWPLG